MLRQLKTRRQLATTLCLLSLAAFAAAQLARGADPPVQAAPLLALLPRAPANAAPPVLDWSAVREDGDGYVQVLADGSHVELTLDPGLQHLSEHVLGEHATRYAGAVLLAVEDGRVLALAGHSRAEPERTAAELTLQPWAPAASIFKLVTAAALIDAGVAADARVCYHDGVHSVEPSNLAAHPRLDGACATLAYGVAKSQNAILARLAHDHLDPSRLERAAHALGFGRPLPFDLPVAPSTVAVPAHDPLAFARVAAGFWSTTLSPLHGAYLAATLARQGVTPPLRLIDRLVTRAGEVLRPEGAEPQRALSGAAARALTRMMVGTTEYGTARLGFHDRRTGRPLLPGVAVAGKTGSLNRVGPCSDAERVGCQGEFLAYSWFVGFAPAERPEVAVAVLLGNGEDWHVKAHQVAAELLSGYFHGTGVSRPATNRRIASR